MKIWKYRMREKEPKGLFKDTDWDNGFVNAETFDEARAKVKAKLKEYTENDLPLMITELSLQLEVDIE